MHKTYELIEISEDDDENDVNMDTHNSKREKPKSNKNNDIINNIEITIVNEYRKNDDLSDEFVAYCIENKLFDNDYYDYSNVFSIIGTKLPMTFDDIAKNTTSVNKPTFCSYFKNFKNPEYIFDIINKDNKKYIQWDDFKEFFLPYIKNVAM